MHNGVFVLRTKFPDFERSMAINMSRKRRVQIKLLLIFCGIVFLAVLAVANISKLGKITPKEGEYISLSKVLLLLETVEPSLAQKEEYALLKSAETEFMTYGQYLQLCAMTGAETIEYPSFKREYEEAHFVTKGDFEEMFSLFLKTYDAEGKMQVKEVTILGGAENSSLASMEQDEKEGTAGGKIGKNQAVTTEGIYEIADEDILRYRFSTIRVYTYENRLITEKEIVNAGYNMKNVWVMEADKERICLFYNGYELTLAEQEIAPECAKNAKREQVADVTFEQGVLKDAVFKTDKINGKILNIKESSVVLEGNGEFEIAEDFKAYRLYGRLEEIGKNDLIVGYDFTDFVIEKGKICAGLVIKEEAMQNIRVLIKASGYSGIYHEKIELTCDTDFSVSYGIAEQMETEQYKAGETVLIEKGSGYFEGDRVYVKPSVLSGKIKLLHMNRSQGTPEYRGTMELCLEDGNIFVINEVLLEEYLYSVVPSEMPASYPEEALKAQAVCARTYAYAKMLKSPLAWYGAHVDDSTSYQVYNNISEKAETTKAAKETAGVLLSYGEELVGAYYYSTSCGFGTTAQVWKSGSGDIPYLLSKRIGEGETITGEGDAWEEGYTAEELMNEETFQQFIQETNAADFEKEEGWYRWTYSVKEIDSGKIEEILQKRYAANEKLVLIQNKEGEYESRKIKNIGKIKDIYVEKRNAGGVIDELIIAAENATIKVITEHNIRYVLNDGVTAVIRQDGSEIASANLLPSAFFMISADKDGEYMVGYTIVGGGFGHGVGMSQNGAKSMAAKGWKYEDILTFFYEGSSLYSIYE